MLLKDTSFLLKIQEKNEGIWVIERSRWYVEYVCSMNVCQLDCVAKKVTIKTNDDDKLHFHNDVFYYTARVHTRIDSPGTLKFPLLSLSLNLATVFWSQRWWHTDKQQYRFIVKFANLIFWHNWNTQCLVIKDHGSQNREDYILNISFVRK